MKAKLILLFSVLFIGVGFKVPAPDRVITGKVTDDRQQAISGVSISVKGTTIGTTSNRKGEYSLKVPDKEAILVFSFFGFETKEVPVRDREKINVVLTQGQISMDEVVVVGYGTQRRAAMVGSVHGKQGNPYVRIAPPYHNTEDYSPINENIFHDVTSDPLSTFSIDVDAASYGNIRRFLDNGERPPVDAVRTEELINYFNYEYAQPEGDDPVNIVTEISEAPWNKNNRLVQIGLQGKTIPTGDLPASNLVFLIDVSGSMQAYNKLPLLKQAFKLLAGQLRGQDRVAIVTYAASAGVALESTPGSRRKEMKDAIDQLQAGGSTAGGAGIQMAYKIAREHFIEGGNNRVILATDGDFNVGVSSDGELQRLIEEERESGVFLSVLGFGMGNYKDNKLELLADKGNGNYAYIDTFGEARKVFVNEFGGTLFTIAKDVKLQVEFNPKYVKAYRLIGYENRQLNDEDFEDDKKDAGEMGSGHTVTALYEIIPANGAQGKDRLKYQDRIPGRQSASKEVLTVKLRYKRPEGDASREISEVLTDSETSLKDASDDFRFAASVAGFGLLLRDSEFKGTANYDEMIRLAENAKGLDREGYRSEFIGLLKSARILDNRKGQVSLND